ncbi:substrate-binding domain-containing protein [Paenibacillus frigoriresistens]|uniref:substrate-binding domain-containing protein n=1 Tax=Paenibacillus alginolyticus TaxID=59839 RepID=UPI001564D65E|nr:substrate-binding domain-containing protein [Paenibacillus frigoriresistens]NRF95911.1 substrate-binding domain-containing protein [Paenibacillus frigoriresistens]
MKVKRLLASIGLTVSLILTAACSNGSATNNKESTAPAADAPKQTAATAAASVKIELGKYCGKECQDGLTLKASPDSIKGKVGFAIASLGFSYGVSLKSLTEEAAKKYFPNMELLVGDGQGDPNVQSNIVDDFISKGVKVIIINAVEKDALVPAIERAKKAGIKVISIDRTVNTEVGTTIKSDDIELGTAVGKQLVTVLNGKGRVIEIQGSPGASPTNDRHEGLMRAVKDSPDIKIIASQYANYNQSDAMKVMEDFLQRFSKGEVDAVFAQDDEMAQGAIQAIKASGRLNEIKVFSTHGNQTSFDSIIKGETTATGVYAMPSPMGVVAAAKALAGEPLPSFIKLDSAVVITKENIDKYNHTTY